MAYLLHIETSTRCCSVCISEKDKPIDLKEIEDTNTHAAKITLLIRDCCGAAGIKLDQLKAVSISTGPGSYTSLRIGTSVAKGICYAQEVPLIAVDTLKSMAFAAAQAFPEADFYVPMIDARRMDVYSSIYTNKLDNIVETRHLTLSDTSFLPLLEDGKQVVICGDANEKCRKVITHGQAIFSTVSPSSKHLTALAWESFKNEKFADVAYYTPYYLKAPNITVPKDILR